MCYFNGVTLVSTRVVSKRQALAAWKGFNERGRGTRLQYPYYSPYYNTVLWRPRKARRASAHGFYAVARRPRPGSAAAGGGSIVLPVLVWGRVREYRGYSVIYDEAIQGYGRRLIHGYRAQFCMIVKEKKGGKK